MHTQKLVTTNFPNEFNQPIIIRQCSEPIEAVPKICEALKYNHKPFTRKKAVVPPPELKKMKVKRSTNSWMDNCNVG